MITADGFIPFTCKLNTERYNETAYLISDDYNATSFKISEKVSCDDQFFLIYEKDQKFDGTRANIHINFDEDVGRVWEGPFIMLCAILSVDCEEASKLYNAIRNKEHLELDVDMLEVLKPTEEEFKYIKEEDTWKYYGTFKVTVDPLWM